MNWFYDLSKKDKRLIIVISSLIVLCLGLLFYGIFFKLGQSRAISTYDSQYLKKVDDSVDNDIALAEKYNEIVRDLSSGVGNISDENNLGNYEKIFSKNNGMIGVLTVPKSDIRLPIYHNADDETISKGAGHVSYTAFPLDTVGSKSVLTSHNGMPGADMLFTRLDETVVGDEFTVQISNNLYHYSVKELKVITPEEADVYARTPIGENNPANVTLVTCTPYGINSHRLLVIGEFKSKEIVSENGDNLPKTKFSLGKETIVILVLATSSFGLIVYIIKKNAK